MGDQARCRVKIGKNKFKGMVYLESGKLIIRRSEPLHITLGEIRNLSVEKDILQFVFRRERFAIDAGNKAGLWFRKIKYPKTVFEKLGVKTVSVVSILNIEERKFLSEIKHRSKKVSFGKCLKNSDLVFLGANSLKELKKLSEIRKKLLLTGAMWVVSLKGKRGQIKDVELMKAAKKHDLIDIKVVSFSNTHTALKFVIPLKSRR